MQESPITHKQVVYTYGSYLYNAKELLCIAKRFHINCIINLSADEHDISEDIRNNSILYGSFWQYFEKNYVTVSDKHNKLSYEKAILQPQIIQGLERIKKGADQGYRLMLIDHTPDTQKSARYTLIGKYLTSAYSIMHIITPMFLLSQEQLETKLRQKREKDMAKKKEAAELGTTGEEIAGLYLTQHNFRILDHNWNLHKGCEIDIIALKNNKLHFIEVKTRSSDKYGPPEAAITPQKMRNIRKAAIEYRYRHQITDMPYQIDSIAIVYHSLEDYTIRYFPDIQQHAYQRNYNKPYRNH